METVADEKMVDEWQTLKICNFTFSNYTFRLITHISMSVFSTSVRASFFTTTPYPRLSRVQHNKIGQTKVGATLGQSRRTSGTLRPTDCARAGCV